MSLSCSRVSDDFRFIVPDLDILDSSVLQQNYLGHFAAPFLSPITQPCSLSFFSSIKANCLPGSRRAGGFPRPCKMASSWTVGKLLLSLPYPTIHSESRTLTLQAEGEGAASHPLCGFSFWSLLLLVAWVCLFAFLVWGAV